MDKYDGQLQMVVEPEHDADPATLEFLRWLVRTGRLAGDTLPSTTETSVAPPSASD